MSTASVQLRRSPTSTATKGVLLYRGYPIEQLAAHCDFLETCYLLLKGELPTPAQKKEFVECGDATTPWCTNRCSSSCADSGATRIPMAVLTGLVGAMSAFYHDSLDITNPHDREISAMRLIAKMPTLVAMSYKYYAGPAVHLPENDLSYTANFVRMMFATPCEDYKVNDMLVRAMDRIFILHADHEQNASTSTVRLCGSSGTNPFAAIAAGIACLWGPAHGGANEACLNMLQRSRRGRRGKARRIHHQGEGQELRAQPDGLRAPGVQELRSAREADARDMLRGARRSSALQTTRCSSSPWRWRKSRSRTTTS